MSGDTEEILAFRGFGLTKDPKVDVSLKADRKRRLITIEWNDCIYDGAGIIHPELGDVTVLDGRISDINRFVSEQIRKAGEKRWLQIESKT